MKTDTNDQATNNDENSPIIAAALGYDQKTDPAPRVLACGSKEIAKNIIQISKENQIPIREDPILAETLLKVDLNGVIPPELYEIIAEILVYVYKLEK